MNKPVRCCIRMMAWLYYWDNSLGETWGEEPCSRAQW